MFTPRCWVDPEAATLHTNSLLFSFFPLPCFAGWLDRDQMEEVCVAGSHLCTHPLPGDRGGPHPMQLQPLLEGRRAECMAAQPAAGPEGALALLVGGRPQLRRSHPPWACRWGASWHTHKGMFFFLELCRHILFMLFPHYMYVRGQGRLLDNTESACRDFLNFFISLTRVYYCKSQLLCSIRLEFGCLL